MYVKSSTVNVHLLSCMFQLVNLNEDFLLKVI